jgi:hypothetical protein
MAFGDYLTLKGNLRRARREHSWVKTMLPFPVFVSEFPCAHQVENARACGAFLGLLESPTSPSEPAFTRPHRLAVLG